MGLTFENVEAPKGAVFITSETSLVKALVKFKRQQLPLTVHCAHKRHVTPKAFLHICSSSVTDSP